MSNIATSGGTTGAATARGGAGGAGGGAAGGTAVAGSAPRPPVMTGAGGMAAAPATSNGAGGAPGMMAAGAGMGAGAAGGPARGGAGGGGAAAGGAGGGGATEAGPKFSEVHSMILMPKCGGCHGASGGVMLAMKDAAYTSLMGMSTMGMCMGMKRVDPGKPDTSVLVMAVKGTGCRMGRPMPPMGAMLSSDEVKKISDWITAGAMNN